jgi:predicted ester cyclase
VIEVERNKAVVREFVAAVNAQDWARVASLIAPEFVRHSHSGGSPGVRSRHDLLRFLRNEFETFPDAREEVADLLAEGDRVAVRHSFRGTQTGPMGPHPPSGRVMVADYLAIYRLVGGVIVEAWAEWDNLSGLVQLGHYKQAEPGAAADGGA